MNSAGKALLYIAVFFFSAQLNFSQELEQQYKYSLSLYDKEEYFNAVTEFKRLLYFDSAGVYTYKANFYIGSSYKAGGRFSDAIKYYSKALASAENNEQVYESKIEIVKSNILRRTLKQAHFILDYLEKSGFKDKITDLTYWRGWVYIFEDKWDKAAEIFEKTPGASELSRLAANVHNEKYSVTAAKILSYLLPGAGQFYTGNYISGLLSLGWNALWGYITINSFIEDRIFDGFAVANFLWLRFYRGNVQNAEKFAIEKNIEINNNALRYLKDEYRGAKP